MKYLKRFENHIPVFKIGDTVRCIDTYSAPKLKKNVLYTIDDVDIDPMDGEVFYKIEGMRDGIYRESRFISATQEEIDQEKYNL